MMPSKLRDWAKGRRICVNIQYNIPGTVNDVKRMRRPVVPVKANKGLKIPGLSGKATADESSMVK